MLGDIALRGFAAQRDQPASAPDDTLEMVLSPNEAGKPIYRFGVNAKNVQYDLRDGDASFNADWKSAVQTEAKAWTAEFAIPWSAPGLKSAPAPDTKFRVNLNRRRTPSQSYYVHSAVMSQLSSWSQVLGDWNEPARFGTWTF